MPTAEDLVNTKYRVEDFQRPTAEVWDENWDVVALYLLHKSQWRTTMAGVFALDMTIFLHELDRKKIPDDEYDDFVQKLAVIEAAALMHINR